jgi:CRISPR-associated protein Csx17
MPILTLHGCSTEPLGNYLKALGIFRLVAEQADPTARAWWEAGTLRLSTTKFLTVEDLCDWLHENCCYSAFVAPWLANTGWGKGGKRDAGGVALKSGPGGRLGSRAITRRTRRRHRSGEMGGLIPQGRHWFDDYEAP